MVNLSKLEEVKDLREVWKNEARDFTPWLAEDDNIEILADAIGLDISIDETEASVGDFNVDISASESGTERKIIIENQLEDTNHDHLGKLITYASGKSADIVIWVVKHARDEHKRAIEWLNEHTDQQIGFFLCEIKLFRIGDSNIAPKFEIIEKPNDWAKEIKKQDSLTGTQQKRIDFWTGFVEYASKNADFMKQFNLRRPMPDPWMDFAVGSSRCHLTVWTSFQKNYFNVHLYINEDKDLYFDLLNDKDDIEKIAGMELQWYENEDKKATKIILSHEYINLNDPANWEELFSWACDALALMKKAFKKYI